MSPFRTFLLVVTIAGSTCTVAKPANGQPSRVEQRLESGRRAFLSGNNTLAIERLEQAIALDGVNAEAHYLVARALLANGELGAAGRSIRRARDLDSSRLEYAVVELAILTQSTPRESSISVTDGRRLTLAKRILEEDRNNGVALEELGIHHANSYRWYANFDATREPIGNSVKKKALDEFRVAIGYLQRAITAEPQRISAYRELIRLLTEEGKWTKASEVVQTALTTFPHNPEPWLFGGLVAQLQLQSEQAAPLFSRALELMDPSERNTFEDVDLFLVERGTPLGTDTRGPVADFWVARDPFRLTTVNERLMDHYARFAYAELWYGSGESPGWDTERGQIVLRYGIPWSDATFVAGYSRFNVLEYRDFEFVFEDQTRGGHYTMYSPKASASSSWTGDYVIQAAEMAKSDPEQYDPKALTTVALQVQTSVFRGLNGRPDVYVHVRVPAPEPDSLYTLSGSVGAFVVDTTGIEQDRATTRVTGSKIGGSSADPEVTLALLASRPSQSVEIEFLSDDRNAVGRLSLPAQWPDFQSDSLAASDLLPARVIEDDRSGRSPTEGTMVRSGYSIEPMPWTQLGVGTDLIVYFELYGLDLDHDGTGTYRLDAVLRPVLPNRGITRVLSRIFGGAEDEESVAASIESKTTGPDEARFITIALPNDAVGEFELEIVILDLNSGQRVSRRHALAIR